VDYALPDGTGLSLLEARAHAAGAPAFIFLTATDSAEICLSAIRAGAADYIVKGTDYLRTLSSRIVNVVRAGSSQAGASLVRSFPGVVPVGTALDQMLGASTEMVRLKQAVLRAARSDLPVLIEGPTGTGKELVARAIHGASDRSSKAFVAVNCAGVPEGLFESEMFGHVRGAFTSASAGRRGLALAANRGTLFLDEVGELALENQAKLLRFLQGMEFRPVGSDENQRADVRVIAATNRSLRRNAAAREFREDLFYRLAVLHIAVPPLNVRSGDVRLLAHAMVRSFAPRLGLATPEIAEEAYEQLERHSWPGNVRELENVVKRTLATEEVSVVRSFTISGETEESSDRAQLERLLIQFSGNLTQVARELGVSRPTLYKRLNSIGVRAESFRRP
jgi:DNA-binding NtrC family response regulator